MQVRQVVTGHDANARAVFVQDKQIEGTAIPGLGELCSSGVPMSRPLTRTRERIRVPRVFSLPVGGVRFLLTSYTPQSTVAPEPTPEMHAGDDPGMHSTTRRTSEFFSRATWSSRSTTALR